MKTIVINADPKMKQEIGKLLKSASEGAESVGSEIEYFNLYKMDLKGCMNCSICKNIICFMSSNVFNRMVPLFACLYCHGNCL